MIAMAPAARAHGDEAAFHNVEGVSAPTLEVTASAEGPVMSLHLDTTNFAWASGTAVANFTEGEGAARVYFDTNRAARIFSPDVTFDARAWNLAPGEHTVTVVLTGSDLVSYAADGEEVEVTVPFTVGEAVAIDSVQAPSGSSFTVTGVRDPFGGWVFTSTLDGFGGTGAQLEYALDGKPWARTQGGSIHVYPDAIIGKQWQDKQPLPVITVTAMNSDGAAFENAGSLATLTFAAPISTDPATWSWPGEVNSSPWKLIAVIVGLAVVLVVAAALVRFKIRSARKSA